MATPLPTRDWMTVGKWPTAHLLTPAGNGWRTECGRHTTKPVTPAPDQQAHCAQCKAPAGTDRRNRPVILAKRQPSRATIGGRR